VDQATVVVVTATVAATVVEAKDAVVTVMVSARWAGMATATVAASRAIGHGSAIASSPKRKGQPIRPKMRSKVFCSLRWRHLTRSSHAGDCGGAHISGDGLGAWGNVSGRAKSAVAQAPYPVGARIFDGALTGGGTAAAQEQDTIVKFDAEKEIVHIVEQKGVHAPQR
jgi:hypothetical protein